MSVELESAIEDDIVCEAEGDGWLVRKVEYVGRRGCPDRWFFKGGRLVIIEFKRPGERPNPQQSREHNRLRLAGFPVHVIDNREDARALLGL